MNKKIDEKYAEYFIIIVLITCGILFLVFALIGKVNAANPTGPDSIAFNWNSTMGATNPQILNLSGGYIASINITSTSSDVRWKGFVGYATGKFVLADSGGSKIYDWTLNTITGKIYATRNSTYVSWSNINCSNITELYQENNLMNHTNANDNISTTFVLGTHQLFVAAGNTIYSNTCPTLNTYENNHSQDSRFEEMALNDGYNMVYTTIIEPTHPNGYNNVSYDFQMIVPENGLATFKGATAYYIYIELG